MANSMLQKYAFRPLDFPTPYEFGQTTVGHSDSEKFEFALSPQTPFYSRIRVANDCDQDLVASASAIRHLLSSFSMHLTPEVRTGIFRQTKRLIAVDDWDDDCQLPSVDSYRTMLRTLVELEPQERPRLGLADTGEFLSMWFSDQQKFSVEYLPNDRVRWVATSGIDSDQSRTSGTTPVKKMLELIDALDLRGLLNGTT